MTSSRVKSKAAAPSAGDWVRASAVALALPSTTRKLIVASGSAAIATEEATIRIDSTIHMPFNAWASAKEPNSSGAIDQTAPSAMPSSIVSRTSRRLAVRSVRWRTARRRKATATPTAATSAPQLASFQIGTRLAKFRTISVAPSTLAASMKSASWLPAFIWAARIGPQSVVSAGS